MARISLYSCDLCKTLQNEDLMFLIVLSESGSEDNARHGEICKECYESLCGRLDGETELPISQLPRTEPVKTSAVVKPLIDIGDEDGISIVPSKMTDAMRRETNQKLSQECRHNDGFSFTDEGPTCRTCNKLVNAGN